MMKIILFIALSISSYKSNLLIASPNRLNMGFEKNQKQSVRNKLQLDENKKNLPQKMALRKPVAYQCLNLGINIEDDYTKIKYNNVNGYLYRKNLNINNFEKNNSKIEPVDENPQVRKCPGRNLKINNNSNALKDVEENLSSEDVSEDNSDSYVEEHDVSEEEDEDSESEDEENPVENKFFSKVCVKFFERNKKPICIMVLILIWLFFVFCVRFSLFSKSFRCIKICYRIMIGTHNSIEEQWYHDLDAQRDVFYFETEEERQECIDFSDYFINGFNDNWIAD